MGGKQQCAYFINAREYSRVFYCVIKHNVFIESRFQRREKKLRYVNNGVVHEHMFHSIHLIGKLPYMCDSVWCLFKNSYTVRRLHTKSAFVICPPPPPLSHNISCWLQAHLLLCNVSCLFHFLWMNLTYCWQRLLSFSHVSCRVHVLFIIIFFSSSHAHVDLLPFRLFRTIYSGFWIPKPTPEKKHQNMLWVFFSFVSYQLSSKLRSFMFK